MPAACREVVAARSPGSPGSVTPLVRAPPIGRRAVATWRCRIRSRGSSSRLDRVSVGMVGCGRAPGRLARRLERGRGRERPACRRAGRHQERLADVLDLERLAGLERVGRLPRAHLDVQRPPAEGQPERQPAQRCGQPGGVRIDCSRTSGTPCSASSSSAQGLRSAVRLRRSPHCVSSPNVRLIEEVRSRIRCERRRNRSRIARSSSGGTQTVWTGGDGRGRRTRARQRGRSCNSGADPAP